MDQKLEILDQLDDAGIGFGPSPQELASRLLDRANSFCPNCGAPLDAFRMCPDVDPLEAAIGIRFCDPERTFKEHPDSCSCTRCINTRKLVN